MDHSPGGLAKAAFVAAAILIFKTACISGTPPSGATGNVATPTDKIAEPESDNATFSGGNGTGGREAPIVAVHERQDPNRSHARSGTRDGIHGHDPQAKVLPRRRR